MYKKIKMNTTKHTESAIRMLRNPEELYPELVKICTNASRLYCLPVVHKPEEPLQSISIYKPIEATHSETSNWKNMGPFRMKIKESGVDINILVCFDVSSLSSPEDI